LPWPFTFTAPLIAALLHEGQVMPLATATGAWRPGLGVSIAPVGSEAGGPGWTRAVMPAWWDAALGSAFCVRAPHLPGCTHVPLVLRRDV